MDQLEYTTLRLKWELPCCYVQIYRPQAGNTISDMLIREMNEVLTRISDSEATILVLEGLPDVFCYGADFQSIQEKSDSQNSAASDPNEMFDVCYKLAFSDFLSICRLRGKVNAGGVGFACACDIVVAERNVLISLSEMLFGLIPAVIFPFIRRRICFQKANYLTITTKVIDSDDAHRFGIVDEVAEDSDILIRKLLTRMRFITKKTIRRYKVFQCNLSMIQEEHKIASLKTNLDVFSDRENINGIKRFTETGLFPWEEDLINS